MSGRWAKETFSRRAEVPERRSVGLVLGTWSVFRARFALGDFLQPTFRGVHKQIRYGHTGSRSIGAGWTEGLRISDILPS